MPFRMSHFAAVAFFCFSVGWGDLIILPKPSKTIKYFCIKCWEPYVCCMRVQGRLWRIAWWGLKQGIKEGWKKKNRSSIISGESLTLRSQAAKQ